MEIKIGQTVRDAVTGFTGIAVQRMEELSGNIRFGVQRKQNEGETAYPETILLDHHTLDVVDDGIVDRVVLAPAHSIPLGSHVKDLATGLSGIAIEVNIYMNGCIRYGVTPEKENGSFLNSNPDLSYIEEGRLKVRGKGISNTAKKADVQAPGGPAVRLSATLARR